MWTGERFPHAQVLDGEPHCYLHSDTEGPYYSVPDQAFRSFAVMGMSNSTTWDLEPKYIKVGDIATRHSG